MTNPSVAPPARNTTPGSVLERIEEEIHRLREKRPALDVVIDRAANILLAHLSCPKQRVIVVRIGLGGRAKFLVSSLNERGAVYTINPSFWACSCPAMQAQFGLLRFVAIRPTYPQADLPQLRGEVPRGPAYRGPGGARVVDLVPGRPAMLRLYGRRRRDLVSAFFPLGRIVATPGALKILTPEEPIALLMRHQSGDWGDVPPADAKENLLSVKRGFRVLSSYVAASGVKVWVVTEADRSSTCILLPEEY